MKKTNLRLFHYHMMIEPVIENFCRHDGETGNKLKRVVFEEFVKSDSEGMSFTCMWEFGQPSDWEYIERSRVLKKMGQKSIVRS